MIPEPVTVTTLGDPAALCAICTVALFAPVLVGRNVTDTVHDPPGATVPHVVLVANWVGLVPARVTPVTTRLAVPVFVTVTTCGADTIPTT